MAYIKKEALTGYQVVTVVSYEQIGNSTSYKRDDHTDEIQQLFLDGWIPFGNPFVDVNDKRTVYQAFVK